jgi:hypothetical protein
MNVMINDMSKDLDTSVQGVQVAISIFAGDGGVDPPGDEDRRPRSRTKGKTAKARTARG